jgi:hypothetical protein
MIARVVTLESQFFSINEHLASSCDVPCRHVPLRVVCMQTIFAIRKDMKPISNATARCSHDALVFPKVVYYCVSFSSYPTCIRRYLVQSKQLTKQPTKENDELVYVYRRAFPSNISPASSHPRPLAISETVLPASSRASRSTPPPFSTSSLKTFASPFSTACMMAFHPR